MFPRFSRHLLLTATASIPATLGTGWLGVVERRIEVLWLDVALIV